MRLAAVLRLVGEVEVAVGRLRMLVEAVEEVEVQRLRWAVVVVVEARCCSVVREVVEERRMMVQVVSVGLKMAGEVVLPRDSALCLRVVVVVEHLADRWVPLAVAAEVVYSLEVLNSLGCSLLLEAGEVQNLERGEVVVPLVVVDCLQTLEAPRTSARTRLVEAVVEGRTEQRSPRWIGLLLVTVPWEVR